jgi:hypothetical protein
MHHEHLLFYCSLGDSAWNLATNISRIFDENTPAIPDEVSLWRLMNDPMVKDTVKITILCAVKARWGTFWQCYLHPEEEFASATRLFVKNLNNAVSAEYDKIKMILDDSKRQEKSTEFSTRWHTSLLFHKKYGNYRLASTTTI